MKKLHLSLALSLFVMSGFQAQAQDEEMPDEQMQSNPTESNQPLNENAILKYLVENSTCKSLSSVKNDASAEGDIKSEAYYCRVIAGRTYYMVSKGLSQVNGEQALLSLAYKNKTDDEKNPFGSVFSYFDGNKNFVEVFLIFQPDGSLGDETMYVNGKLIKGSLTGDQQ